MIYRKALRPLLFWQDAETAHERTLELLSAMNGTALRLRRPAFTSPVLRMEVAGLTFPNPVGLAAGCDKNAKAVAIWPQFGFGFVEIGTVTAQAQAGNPKPRMFRIPEHGAIINRLGFNSEGSEVVAKRLANLRRNRHLSVPLGINIGKTKLVTGDDATLDDYRASFRRLSRLADYVAVNVSSPNTPGLRQWQERDKLRGLLKMLRDESRELAVKRGHTPVPLFVKISPDMEETALGEVAEVVLELGLAGIIATNTTIAREGAFAGNEQAGGLSGRPVREKSQKVMKFLYRETQGRIALIGVGGIASAEDAYERILAGASLLQVYTGLVYEGPYLPRQINQGLLRLLQRDGAACLRDIVGKGV